MCGEITCSNLSRDRQAPAQACPGTSITFSNFRGCTQVPWWDALLSRLFRPAGTLEAGSGQKNIAGCCYWDEIRCTAAERQEMSIPADRRNRRIEIPLRAVRLDGHNHRAGAAARPRAGASVAHKNIRKTIRISDH